MKAWQHKLKKAMQHPAAVAFVAKLNAEEQQHRQVLREFKNAGMLVTGTLVSYNEMTGSQIRTSQVWHLKDDRRDKRVFNSVNQRPLIEYTTETRMSRTQAEVVEDMILADWTVWCGVRNMKTGASAIMMRFENIWAIVYEDGSVMRGATPQFAKRWPQIIKVSGTWSPPVKAKPMTMNSDGGFSTSRYAQ